MSTAFLSILLHHLFEMKFQFEIQKCSTIFKLRVESKLYQMISKIRKIPFQDHKRLQLITIQLMLMTLLRTYQVLSSLKFNQLILPNYVIRDKKILKKKNRLFEKMELPPTNDVINHSKRIFLSQSRDRSINNSNHSVYSKGNHH